ncbi:hypothetical protein GCM10010300_67990 [Streptomyces olivaceoviridis]|nr:hypothetical protein GCM10010300_67990 [Streptomyces olivaceoviridis]
MLDGLGALGGEVQVGVRAAEQSVRLEGVAAGQDQTVRAAHGDDVREESAMGFGDVHTKIFPASGRSCATSGNFPRRGGH